MLTPGLVRQYVEGTKDSDKLLDLLAASSGNELEPTVASGGGKTQLYSDVCGFRYISYFNLKLRT